MRLVPIFLLSLTTTTLIVNNANAYGYAYSNNQGINQQNYYQHERQMQQREWNHRKQEELTRRFQNPTGGF